jgi:hypothetical protein
MPSYRRRTTSCCALAVGRRSEPETTTAAETPRAPTGTAAADRSDRSAGGIGFRRRRPNVKPIDSPRGPESLRRSHVETPVRSTPPAVSARSGPVGPPRSMRVELRRGAITCTGGPRGPPQGVTQAGDARVERVVQGRLVTVGADAHGPRTRIATWVKPPGRWRTWCAAPRRNSSVPLGSVSRWR